MQTCPASPLGHARRALGAIQGEGILAGEKVLKRSRTRPLARRHALVLQGIRRGRPQTLGQSILVIARPRNQGEKERRLHAWHGLRLAPRELDAFHPDGLGHGRHHRCHGPVRTRRSRSAFRKPGDRLGTQLTGHLRPSLKSQLRPVSDYDTRVLLSSQAPRATCNCPASCASPRGDRRPFCPEAFPSTH